MKTFVHAILVATLLCATSAFGQTIEGTGNAETSANPHVFRYSGTLPGGHGVVNVTFSLYSVQAGGTAMWTETQNVTLDNNGKFSAVLGTTTALPSGIFL